MLQTCLGGLAELKFSLIHWYYLTGSRKEGYSITILQEKENETLCSKCEQITRSTIDAKRLCYKLVRGIVFPEQLEEIVRDQI